MPKVNTKGGKNFKKAKKNMGEIKIDEPYANESYQRYAQVNKKLGGSLLEVLCSDNIVRHGIIPGKMNKRIWMNVGDVLLVELNNELNKKAKVEECFITHKYSNSMINNLKSKNLINFVIKSSGDDMTGINCISGGDNEDNIQFGESKITELDKISDKLEKINTDNENNLMGIGDKKDKKRLLKEKEKNKDNAINNARKKKEVGDGQQKSNFGDLDFDSI